MIMARRPEPDLMTNPVQARAYAEADFEEPHSHCLQLLQTSLPTLPTTGIALDLGCGPGDITLRFAQSFPGWRVDGVDGSEAMLHYGHRAVADAGLQDRVQLMQAYLPIEIDREDSPLPMADQRYNCIFSNSLLHHLKDPMVLWQSILAWSSSGCAVFVMDLMRPANPDQAQRFVEQYAADEPDILRQDFYHSLLAAYRISEVEQQLQQANLGALQVKAVSDRHLMAWGQLPERDDGPVFEEQSLP